MFKSKIKPIIVLASICLVTAFLLSCVNMLTKDKIEDNLKNKENSSFSDVYPGASKDSDVDLSQYKLPDAITAAYKMSDGGYVFTASVAGKSSGLVIMCGVDTEGKIIGTKVVSSAETPSYSEKVFPLVEGLDGKYKGMDEKTFEPFLVTGATLTSEAYSEAVKAALQSFVIISGGEVDLSTPEEKLNKACNEALGTENLTFARWFVTEANVGVDAIYYADGVDGAVIKVGEAFIGVDANGDVKNSEFADKAETVKTAYNIYKNSTLTEIALPTEASDTVKKMYLTASGNYVFELEAKGYGINGGNKWHPASGKPISIKLCVGADGAIISTLTLEQYESQGFGDKCADEEYYSQYNGKTEENYGTVPKINEGLENSATYTSEGYKGAIKDAFDAIRLHKGGAV